MHYLLLILAAALSGLALPPVGQWWILGLTFPYFVWRMQQSKTAKHAVLSGFCFGLGYFIAAFHWIGFAFLVDADAYLWMMPFAVGGLAAMMACYWAVAALVAYLVPRRILPMAVSLPVAIALVEWLRGYLFTGFPWAAPGLIADGMGGVVQLASLVGMPGLTLLVLLWSALPLALWQNRRGTPATGIVMLVIMATLPIGYVWGTWRLSATPTQYTQQQVRLIQPNLQQGDQWRADNAEQNFARLLTLSKSDTARLVVWPESITVFLLDEEIDRLSAIATALHPESQLLTGSLRRETNLANGERYFTSILSIDAKGQVQGRYDKWRLVPGGEFLPLEWLLSPLGFRQVVEMPESLSAGQGPANFDLGQWGRAGMLICYEAIFPHLLLDEDRPDFIVNVTNDGWFGTSVGPHQHLAQVRMRAIEQGLPIVRSANTGISAVIDPLGRVLVSIPVRAEGVVDHLLPKALPRTLYGRFGDYVLNLLVLVVVTLVVFCLNFADQRSKKRIAQP